MALLPIRIDGTKAIVDLQALQREMEKAAVAGDRAAVSAGKYDEALDKQGQEARKTARETDKLGRETQQAGTKAARAATSTATFNKALGTTRRAAIGARTALLGLVAAGGLTLGLRGAVSTLADYSVQMSTLGFVTRASAEDLAALERQNKSLGASTRFSASQAAEAQTFLARAGFDVQQVMAATPATLRLATVAQMDLGAAADLASNLVSQFGLAAEQTGEVVNALAVVSNRSNSTVAQLGEAMKYAGPFASALGIDIAETAAVMGVLGDEGIQASMAGTSVRAMLANLIQPSEGAEAALARLGLTTDSVKVQQIGLIGAIEKLVERGAGAEEFLAIFGQRQVSAASAMASATARARFLAEEVGNVSDEAERGEQLIGSNLDGALRSLASTAEAATLQTGDKGLTGAIRGTVETGRDAIKILFGLGQEMGDVDDSAGILVISLGALGGALAAITATKVLAGLYAVGAALIGISSAISPVTAALVALGLVGGTIAASFLVANDEFQRTNEELIRMRDSANSLDPAFKSVERAIERVDAAYKAVYDFDGPPRLLTGDEASQVAAARLGALKSLEALRGTFSEQLAAGNVSATQRDELLNAAGFVLGDDAARSRFRDLNASSRGLGESSGERRNRSALLTLDYAIEVARQQEEQARLQSQSIRLEEQRNQIDEARLERIRELRAELEEMARVEEERARIVDSGDQDALARFDFMQEHAEAAELLGDAYASLADRILAARQRQQEFEASTGNNRISGYLRELEFERGQFGLTPNSQEIRLARFRAEQEGATVSELDQVEAMISEIQGLRDLEAIADGIGSAFASSFERAVFEAESLRSVVQALGQDILRIVFRQIVAQPIANAISSGLQSLGGAVGNLFSSGPGTGEGPIGPPQADGTFARGGIVNFASGGMPELIRRDTMFPMSGGRVGRAGESGMEVAIAPLARTSSGRLGVEVANGGSSQRPVVFNMTFNGVPSEREALMARRKVAAAARAGLRDARSN